MLCSALLDLLDHVNAYNMIHEQSINDLDEEQFEAQLFVYSYYALQVPFLTQHLMPLYNTFFPHATFLEIDLGHMT